MFTFSKEPRAKFVIVLLIVMVVITTATAVASIITFSNSLKDIYSDIAYEIADYAATLMPMDKINEYADIAYRYNHGNATDEEADWVMKDPQYQAIETKLDTLRRQMNLNDIYVVVYDIEVLKIDDKEAYEKREWKPMYYIFDVYYAEDMRFPLGGSSRIVYDYRMAVLESCQRLKRTDTVIVTNGDWGNIISAVLPICGDSKMAVGIGVEIPMDVLNVNQNIYTSIILVSMGAIFIVMLIGLLVFILSLLINPVNETINKPWMPPSDQSWSGSQDLKEVPKKPEIERLEFERGLNEPMQFNFEYDDED